MASVCPRAHDQPGRVPSAPGPALSKGSAIVHGAIDSLCTGLECHECQILTLWEYQTSKILVLFDRHARETKTTIEAQQLASSDEVGRGYKGYLLGIVMRATQTSIAIYWQDQKPHETTAYLKGSARRFALVAEERRGRESNPSIYLGKHYLVTVR
jgi:hypothetical protein